MERARARASEPRGKHMRLRRRAVGWVGQRSRVEGGSAGEPTGHQRRTTVAGGPRSSELVDLPVRVGASVHSLVTQQCIDAGPLIATPSLQIYSACLSLPPLSRLSDGKSDWPGFRGLPGAPLALSAR